MFNFIVSFTICRVIFIMTCNISHKIQMERDNMQIQTFSLGPIGTNCYIVYTNDKCLIFDPGAEPDTVTSFLIEHNLEPVAILLTHAHFDHIGAVDPIKKKLNIDVYVHEQEQLWLEDPMLNRSGFYFGESGGITTAKPDQLIDVGS